MSKPWATLFIILVIITQSGCSGIGVVSIKSERNRYNDVVHDTSTEQLLQNIIRGKNYESPTFFDLTEVDQTKSLSGNIQGGSSNIGAASPIGAITSMLSISDAPILKYQLPSSSSYIAQIATPFQLSVLSAMYNSNFDVTPLFVFTIQQLTEGYIDYNRAVDAIDVLDLYGAISIEAVDKDVIVLRPRAQGILTPRVALKSGDNSLECTDGRNPNAITERLWRNLSNMLRQPGSRSIVLRAPNVVKTPGTVVLARSALGSLATSYTHDVAFLPHDEAIDVRRQNDVAPCNNGEFYYYKRPKVPSAMSIAQKWARRFALAVDPSIDVETAREGSRTLAAERALILIETSPFPPEGAYVATERAGVWYSIANDDNISKKNFALLGNILLVQAQPPIVSPTSTVIAAPR